MPIAANKALQPQSRIFFHATALKNGEIAGLAGAIETRLGHLARRLRMLCSTGQPVLFLPGRSPMVRLPCEVRIILVWRGISPKCHATFLDRADPGCEKRRMAPANLPATLIEGDARRLILIGDHASNHVPRDIELGIPERLLGEHVAIDIGVAPLARAICARFGCVGYLGAVSRLVIDLNRELDAPGLIPRHSDGYDIPGNQALDEPGRRARIDRWWSPYHDAVADRIATDRPRMLISLHSFTPAMATCDKPRPWQIGLLYNEDDRGARIAMPLLEAAGVVTGDNLPYSGKLLNATVNRHAEGNGIAYLNFEVRQDLVSDAAGVAHWAEILAPVIERTAEILA